MVIGLRGRGRGETVGTGLESLTMSEEQSARNLLPEVRHLAWSDRRRNVSVKADR